MARLPQQPPAEVTVAVVSWNTRRLLADCLRALEPEAVEGRAEVWVLDNASTDGSGEMVAERFPWVRLIASPENLGFGAAVNRIAAQTATPWLAPANADTQVFPGTLRALLEEGERHPEAAVVAPRLVLPDGSTQHSGLPFPTIGFTLAYVLGATAFSRRLARRWSIGRGFEPERRKEVPWAVGAFLLVRRVAFVQVEGFDEEQWMYAEDLDLGWRLARAGWRTRYLSSAPVLHNESAATSRAWGDARHARWHASTYAWLLRRRGLGYARAVAITNVGGFLARALLLLLLAPLGSGRLRDARHSAVRTARAHLVGLRSRSFLMQVR